MRYLKLRAWDKEENKMLGPKSIHGCVSNIFSTREVFRPKDEAQQLIWMQCTGLLDKSGKEIYEGDIVQIFDWNDKLNTVMEICYGTHRVGYDSDYASTGPALGFYGKNENNEDIFPGDEYNWDSTTKVIGNIYENVGLIDEH